MKHYNNKGQTVNSVIIDEDNVGLATESKLDDILTELTNKTEPGDTQSISGTVTANAGTNLNTSALALEATLQDIETLVDNIGADLIFETKKAVISASSSGDNTLIAAVADKKIRVMSCMLVASDAVSVRFESGGDALTGIMALIASTGFVLPYNPKGWFETASNTLLNLELSGAVSVGGCLTYIEV